MTLRKILPLLLAMTGLILSEGCLVLAEVPGVTPVAASKTTSTPTAANVVASAFALSPTATDISLTTTSTPRSTDKPSPLPNTPAPQVAGTDARLLATTTPNSMATDTPASALPPAPIPEHPSPDFTLPDLEGNQVRLSDFRGQVVLINFWATW